MTNLNVRAGVSPAQSAKPTTERSAHSLGRRDACPTLPDRSCLRTLCFLLRRVRPFGLAGGEPGEVGANLVRRKDGRVEKLAGCDATVLDAGEAIMIQTPTAGGCGDVAAR